MTDRELMQMALDALEKHVLEYETVEALRARLAQPDLMTPAEQGLTDEEIEKLVYDIRSQTTGVVATAYVARAIEAKLKEKNT